MVHLINKIESDSNDNNSGGPASQREKPHIAKDFCSLPDDLVLKDVYESEIWVCKQIIFIMVL